MRKLRPHSVGMKILVLWIFLATLQSNQIFARKLGPEVIANKENSEEATTPIYPTLNSPSEPGPTTFFQESTDFNLNFDGVTLDPELLDSLETTTNVFQPSASKSGRHFSSRRGILSNNNDSTSKQSPNILFPPPALKPRPTASVISYNPTNYNRIVKRRKGQPNGPEQSTDGIEEATTTSFPPTTWNPFISSRKVTLGLRTNRLPIRRQSFNTTVFAVNNEDESVTDSIPKFSSINRRVKITPVIRLPSSSLITTSQSPIAEQGSQVPITVSASPSNSQPFEYNPSFTVSDGVYHFKYSSVHPETSSRRVHSEEFGIKRESYGDEDENDDEGDTHPFGQEEKTSTMPIHGTTSVPLHSSTNIDGSEEEIELTSLPPSYRDFFNGNNRNHEKHFIPEDQIVSPMPPGNFVKSSDENIQPKQVSEVTVTVTITEKSKSPNHAQLDSNSDAVENGNMFNLLNLQVLPTPALPSIPSTTTPKTSDNSIESKVENVPEPIINTGGHTVTSNFTNSKPTEGLTTATTITSSKDFKSIYYTTTQHPLFSSTSYSFSSSTEYSFFVPDDNGHGHDEGHSHDHNFHGHDHEHEPSLEQDHSISSEHNVEDENNTEKDIHPTSSTLSYWDTLGLKTVKVNLNTSSSEHLPSPSPSPPGDLVGGFSTPEANTEIPTTQKNATIETLTTTTPKPIMPTSPSTSSTEDISSSHELSNEENKLSSSEEADKLNPVHIDQGKLPEVAVLIQVLLDMPAVQFCPSANTFKEMIILVYRRNKMDISLDQVVLFSVPDCNTIKFKQKGIKAKFLRENDSHNKLNDSGSFEYTPSMAKPSELYVVYLYINDKNGTYDRTLTESFIDLWNATKSHDDIFFNRIKKIEMITSGQITHAPANENTGIIAAITISAIAAVCLLLLGVLLVIMKHRQTQNKFAKRCTPVTLDDYSLDNISVFSSFRRKQRNRASKRSFTNAAFDDPHAPSRPLDVAGLESTVKDVSAIHEEFGRIPNINPTLDDIPQGAESKNRFANVIPLPDTRVLLTFQDDQPNSDYINANFTRGANNTNKAYIITQGPLEETIVDFWRMIWEQQVRVVFMLTDFAEAGIPKCAEYYPRSETIDCSQLHGDFQVTLEKRDVAEHCITSYLVIKDMERNLRRDVVHFWFHTWPEKGIPDSPKPTIDFLLKTRKFTKEACPIVVHCSPGTGRSGTIVACDIGIKELETQRRVDIPQIVKRIRQDRAGAVQTKEQYKYIYDVIQYYSSKHLNSIGS